LVNQYTPGAAGAVTGAPSCITVASGATSMARPPPARR
jgi:hypothetical protein